MSRELRRVPLNWKHPTVPNPYWREKSAARLWRSAPESQLHGPTERFVGLCNGYTERLTDWERELADLRARTGWHWTWGIEYHLTGYQGREDTEPTIHPFYVYDEDGNEQPVQVRDEDHLYELEVARKEGERPDPADYMPTWDAPEDSLGWCLYETVSEGTPVTPVFATADELIDHLATVGQDWDQKPMRRSAAETLVRQGGSFGSFAVVGGKLYNSADDADLLGDAFGGAS